MPLPRAMARFNRRVSNRLTGLVAGRLPGLGILEHRGRKSGRRYRTPMNVFRGSSQFKFALTYGRGDWVKNVLEAGDAQLLTRGRMYRLSSPRIVDDPAHAGFPRPVRWIFRLLHVDEVLVMDDAPGVEPSSPELAQE